MDQFANRSRPIQTKPRSLGIAYLLFVIGAFLLFHMFYVRRPGMAIAKILTLNFFFVGMIIDAILMPKYVRIANGAAG